MPKTKAWPKMTKAQGKFVGEKQDALRKAGKNTDGEWIGRPIFSRDGSAVGVVTAAGHGYCGLSGCTGKRLYVTWEDGEKSRPCSKGCTYDEARKEWWIL